jgi:predicted ester cyclase
MQESLIERYYDAFNRRRLAEAAALFADDADLELMPGEHGVGGAGYMKFAAAWIHAFPNAAFTVQRIQPRGETMTEVYLLATGTHCGTFHFGAYRFGESGTEAVLHLRELLDIRDGRITASVLTVDMNDLVTQLTRVDYVELARRIDRIRALGEELEQAVGDATRQRHVANKLGVEVDAARRLLRPHFNR